MKALISAKAAVHGDPEWAEYEAQLDKAISSHVEHPVGIVRTLDEMDAVFGRVPYREDMGPLKPLLRDNCHIGQRKLALALIEFMTKAITSCKSDVFVVYPGASIMACLAAANLFPRARFICYDPSFASTVPNVRRELGSRADAAMRDVTIFKQAVARAEDAVDAFERGASIVVFTDASGMYTDTSHELAATVRSRIALEEGFRREILFVSDVRMDRKGKEPGELQIANEMAAQARWIQLIDAQYWVLKMRLPFLDGDGVLDPKIAAVYAELARTMGYVGEEPGSVPYLDGDAYVQLYGRESTTEMRLVGLKGCQMRMHAIRPVEQIMAAFNVVHRAHTRFTDDSRMPGFADVVDELLSPEDRKGTYDAVVEACILQDAVSVDGPPCDLATLRSCIAEFSRLYAAGRHPRTCVPGAQKHGGASRHGGIAAAALLALTLAMAVLGAAPP